MPGGPYSDIEQAPTEKYGLIDAAVAEPMVDDEPSLLATLGLKLLDSACEDEGPGDGNDR